MDIRKKLVELLQDENNPVWKWFPNNMAMMQLADYLIANGVTVPQWISVDDRLPEKDGYYLCCIKSSLFPDRVYIDVLECDKGSFKEGHIYTDTVTHWKPMPQPPKGE